MRLNGAIYRAMALILAVAVAVAVAGIMSARDLRASATAAANAGARVALPLFVGSEIGLNFGKLKGGLADGTVVVTVQNERYATGGAKIFPNQGYSRGRFSVQGEPGAQYLIELPTSVSFFRHNKVRPMPQFSKLQVIGFTCLSVNAGVEGVVGQLGSDGKDTFYLGGVLEVPKKSKTGEYQGTVDVTIVYQ